jgi:hypothetical protein
MVAVETDAVLFEEYDEPPRQEAAPQGNAKQEAWDGRIWNTDLR